MSLQHMSFDLASIQAAYRSGLSVRELIGEAMQRCATDAHHAFIHRLVGANSKLTTCAN